MDFVLFLFLPLHFLWLLYKEVPGGMTILINISSLFLSEAVEIYTAEKSETY